MRSDSSELKENLFSTIEQAKGFLANHYTHRFCNLLGSRAGVWIHCFPIEQGGGRGGGRAGRRAADAFVSFKKHVLLSLALLHLPV